MKELESTSTDENTVNTNNAVPPVVVSKKTSKCIRKSTFTTGGAENEEGADEFHEDSGRSYKELLDMLKDIDTQCNQVSEHISSLDVEYANLIINMAMLIEPEISEIDMDKEDEEDHYFDQHVVENLKSSQQESPLILDLSSS